MKNEELKKILEDSISFRKRDIEERQIDIDNYRISLAIIEEKYLDQPDVVAYKSHLEELLRTAILEQTKVKIFLEAAQVNFARIED